MKISLNEKKIKRTGSRMLATVMAASVLTIVSMVGIRAGETAIGVKPVAMAAASDEESGFGRSIFGTAGYDSEQSGNVDSIELEADTSGKAKEDAFTSGDSYTGKTASVINTSAIQKGDTGSSYGDASYNEDSRSDYRISVFDEKITLYTSDCVNVRKGAGTEYDKLGTLSRGSNVTALGETENGWYQVLYNNETGYIKCDYLMEKQPGIPFIFAGDSRTVQMSQALNKDSYVWIAKVGEGYKYFSETAVPQIDASVGAGSVIIINYGVNDLYDVDKYIRLINKKIDSWVSAGAQVYYAAVTPVADYPTITNAEIEAFNTTMKSGLDSRVGWLDGYTYLQTNGFSTNDGLHYSFDTYRTLYSYYMSQINDYYVRR